VSVSALKSGDRLALILSSARSARPSKDERVLANARGPPPFPNSDNQPGRTPEALHFREGIRMRASSLAMQRRLRRRAPFARWKELSRRLHHRRRNNS
jgi:hypothetical protein